MHLLQIAACSKCPLQPGENNTEFVFARIFCKAEIRSPERPLKTNERKCLLHQFLRAVIPSNITHKEYDLHAFYTFPLHKARPT